MIEILTPSEMATADRLSAERGVATTTLMENAGQAVARAAHAMIPSAAPVLIVAGPGNNGGDGLVAARHLSAGGHPVTVMMLGDPATLAGDAAWAYAQWGGAVGPLSPDALGKPALIVDALFGAGLARPITGPAAAMIAAINASAAPVLAVDLPSGIDGLTGAVRGCAVTAARTVTFCRRKPGHLLLPGRLHCGATEVVDIGTPAAVLKDIAPQTALNAPPLWAASFPVPRIDGHKYSRGHAVVVGGGLPLTGAARLAARAALRAGAGLVTIACPSGALAIQAAANTAVMVRPADDVAELAHLLSDRRVTGILLGPGGTEEAELRQQVETALQTAAGVVLDAGALTAYRAAPDALFRAIGARAPETVVLTPHEGEFSRLFNALENISDSKLERTKAAAELSGAVVLLKGADTVVASPDGRAAIAENAPPWLATAGSGDVLAGFVLALTVQGMPAFEAAAAAVWLHGEAASQVGPGLIAEDLPEAMPAVLRALFVELAGVANA